jgi:hypothetical protein
MTQSANVVKELNRTCFEENLIAVDERRGRRSPAEILSPLVSKEKWMRLPEDQRPLRPLNRVEKLLPTKTLEEKNRVFLRA